MYFHSLVFALTGRLKIRNSLTDSLASKGINPAGSGNHVLPGNVYVSRTLETHTSPSAPAHTHVRKGSKWSDASDYEMRAPTPKELEAGAQGSQGELGGQEGPKSDTSSAEPQRPSLTVVVNQEAPTASNGILGVDLGPVMRLRPDSDSEVSLEREGLEAISRPAYVERGRTKGWAI